MPALHAMPAKLYKTIMAKNEKNHLLISTDHFIFCSALGSKGVPAR